MSGVARFCDSAGAPSVDTLRRAKRAGVTGWAAYLTDNPYATHGWSLADLDLVLAEGLALIPIYVAPFPAARLSAGRPETDAARALHGLARIRDAVAVNTSAPHRAPLVLDVETSVYYAHPAETVDYVERFVAHVAGDAAVIPYSGPACLLAIRHSDPHPPAHVWAASWRANSGQFSGVWPTAVEPVGLGNYWTGRRAWQIAGNVEEFGRLVDLNVCDVGFPALHHRDAKPAPTPAPRPAPVPHAVDAVEATVTVHGKVYRGRLTA